MSGKAPIALLAGALYYITFIDDFSRPAWILFLQEKSAAKEAIHNFMNLMERQFDTKIKYFFSDNGTEYVNSDVRHFFHEKGIVHNTILAYTHAYNGMAERFNRTISTMVRMLLLHGNLHGHLEEEQQLDK